jgi:hypothetical protein
MAVGLPAKTTYADGDVFSASDINDTNGTLNLVGQTTNFYAGKNKIINGDFAINQRAFTSTTTTATYGFDRFLITATDGTTTWSAQTFTPGTAPVAGYESTNFSRLVSTGQTLTSAASRLNQKIEDVRTFAGQTATYSFWAKASTGTPNVAVNCSQNFGSGGSASVIVAGTKIAITSSWARYSATFSVPSVSGKTIGTGSHIFANIWISAGSDFNTATDSLGIQSVTVDFWGIQMEQGSVATAFQTATGTIQGELAACQRYYYSHVTGNSQAIASGFYYSTTLARLYVPFKQTMRIAPSANIASGSSYFTAEGPTVSNATTLTLTRATPSGTTLDMTVSGVTAGQGAEIYTNNASSYVAFNAEL